MNEIDSKPLWQHQQDKLSGGFDLLTLVDSLRSVGFL